MHVYCCFTDAKASNQTELTTWWPWTSPFSTGVHRLLMFTRDTALLPHHEPITELSAKRSHTLGHHSLTLPWKALLKPIEEFGCSEYYLSQIPCTAPHHKCCTFLPHNPVSVDWESRPKSGSVTRRGTFWYKEEEVSSRDDWGWAEQEAVNSCLSVTQTRRLVTGLGWISKLTGQQSFSTEATTAP